MWLFLLMTSHSSSFVLFFTLAWYLKTWCVLLLLFGASGPLFHVAYKNARPILIISLSVRIFDVQACTTFFCEVTRPRAFVECCFSCGTWCVIVCVTNSATPPTFPTLIETAIRDFTDRILYPSVICHQFQFLTIQTRIDTFAGIGAAEIPETFII